MLGHHRVNDLVKCLAFHHLRQFVDREIDAMIGDAALRKIIGSNPFRAIARSNLAAPFRGPLGVALAALLVIELGAQHSHRLGAVLVLRSFFLYGHDDAAWNVSDADGGFGLVDVLAAGSAGPPASDFGLGLS